MRLINVHTLPYDHIMIVRQEHCSCSFLFWDHQKLSARTPSSYPPPHQSPALPNIRFPNRSSNREFLYWHFSGAISAPVGGISPNNSPVQKPCTAIRQKVRSSGNRFSKMDSDSKTERFKGISDFPRAAPKNSSRITTFSDDRSTCGSRAR